MRDQVVASLSYRTSLVNHLKKNRRLWKPTITNLTLEQQGLLFRAFFSSRRQREIPKICHGLELTLNLGEMHVSNSYVIK